MKESSTETTAFQRDPDVKLMLRAKTGDEGAFSQLVGNYQDRLVGVLTHLVHDRQAAEDLAQEVFLKIYKSRHGYEPTAKFSTYLFRIANNLASNRRRDVGRKREVALAGGDSSSHTVRPLESQLAETSGMMPTRQFDRSEIQAVVREALETLNDNQRIAVLLHKFEEMSYLDIAATLDTSVSAVKSLLSRARDNLRDRLEPYVTQGTWNANS